MTKIKLDTFYLREPFPELHQHKDHLLDLQNKQNKEKHTHTHINKIQRKQKKVKVMKSR